MLCIACTSVLLVCLTLHSQEIRQSWTHCKIHKKNLLNEQKIYRLKLSFSEKFVATLRTALIESKGPGKNGLTTKMFQCGGKLLLTKIREIFSESIHEQRLPQLW